MESPTMRRVLFKYIDTIIEGLGIHKFYVSSSGNKLRWVHWVGGMQMDLEGGLRVGG